MAMVVDSAVVTDDDSVGRSLAAADPYSGRALPHVPALDGLRGAAVLAVLAYHLGWLPGGFLGVSLFFTLSGYLITSLLITERAEKGTIRLGRFWARRARRLLPAALAGAALAVIVTAITGSPDQLRALPGDVAGALGYVANWRFVVSQRSYQAGFAAPSALLHYWSLAIEEQLYVVVPLVVVLAGRRRHERGQRRLGGVLAGLLCVSGLATLVVGPTHVDRIYFGTDTRMAELLAGALLAVSAGFPARFRRAHSEGSRWTTAVSVGAGATVMALWVTTRQSDPWLYRGGFWVVAAASCTLIAAACREGVVSRCLRTPALVWAGTVSYGIYVYHWPLFMLLDADRTGVHGAALAAIRLSCTMGVAAASHRWLENPIRRHHGPLPLRVRLSLPAAAAAIVAVAVLTAGLAGGRSVVAPSRHPVMPRAVTAGAGVDRAATPAAVTRLPLQRVLFMGDSLVQQAFPTFADRLRAMGVDSRVVGGGGQSLMTHSGAWLDQLAGAISSFDPDVVVLESCCGQFRFDAPMTDASGAALTPATPAFERAWRGLAVQASTTAARRGALVMWVLGPPTHTNGWYGPIDAQVSGINAIYASLPRCDPSIALIDWATLGGPGGAYADTITDDRGTPVRIRTVDGFHFTREGIDGLSQLTLPAIMGAWSSSGRPGVRTASCS